MDRTQIFRDFSDMIDICVLSDVLVKYAFVVRLVSIVIHVVVARVAASRGSFDGDDDDAAADDDR